MLVERVAATVALAPAAYSLRQSVRLRGRRSRDALLDARRLLTVEKSGALGEKVRRKGQTGQVRPSELAEGSPAAGEAAVRVICVGRASVAILVAAAARRRESLPATSANEAQHECCYKRPL